MSVERWDDYWGPRPEFGFAAFLPVASAEERLARGRDAERPTSRPRDPAGAGRGPDPACASCAAPGSPSCTSASAWRRGRDNPFTDPRVRRAFHLAIDRDELLRRVAARHGAGAHAAGRAARVRLQSRPAGARPRSGRGPAAAGGGRARGGLRVRLDHPDDRYQAARLLQEQLARVGVTLEPGRACDRGELWERAADSSLFVAGWDCATGEASEFFEFCLHTPRDGYGGRELRRLRAPRASTRSWRRTPRCSTSACGRRCCRRRRTSRWRSCRCCRSTSRTTSTRCGTGLVLPRRADNALRLAEVRVISSAR